MFFFCTMSFQETDRPKFCLSVVWIKYGWCRTDTDQNQIFDIFWCRPNLIEICLVVWNWKMELVDWLDLPIRRLFYYLVQIREREEERPVSCEQINEPQSAGQGAWRAFNPSCLQLDVTKKTLRHSVPRLPSDAAFVLVQKLCSLCNRCGPVWGPGALITAHGRLALCFVSWRSQFRISSLRTEGLKVFLQSFQEKVELVY
jgi:hypothetical protein